MSQGRPFLVKSVTVTLDGVTHHNQTLGQPIFAHSHPPPAIHACLLRRLSLSHSVAVMADQWADDVRLSDIEPQFVCSACGKRGADVISIGTGSRCARWATVNRCRQRVNWRTPSGE
jgi:hypothetical protein